MEWNVNRDIFLGLGGISGAASSAARGARLIGDSGRCHCTLIFNSVSKFLQYYAYVLMVLSDCKEFILNKGLVRDNNGWINDDYIYVEILCLAMC
jgi:hypothetical protein